MGTEPYLYPYTGSVNISMGIWEDYKVNLDNTFYVVKLNDKCFYTRSGGFGNLVQAKTFERLRDAEDVALEVDGTALELTVLPVAP